MHNPYINENGDKCWYNDQGKLHRTDGPAVEYRDGSVEWYLHGKRHREDGPAIDGPQHFIAGPPPEEYYLHDIKLSEEEYLKITQSPKNELPLYLGLGFDEYITKRLTTL